ncbi:MAG: MFS transporter, partial [Gemmatimonadales bacterium]
FLQPARTALGAAMVPRELRPNAVAWRSTTWQFGAVAGPALGGILNAAIGAAGAFIAAAGLVLVGLGSMVAIRFRAVPDGGDGASVLTSLAEGIRYLRGQQILLGAMTLDLFSMLFGGAVALLPIFVADILHTGVWGLGLLRAAPAVGALGMSLFLASRPPLKRAGRDLLVAVAAFGVFTIGFGLARTIWLSFFCLAAGGAADMISVVIRATLLQLMVPDRLMGRVTSVNAIFIGSSNEIGSFESGVTARIMGAVPAVLAGGAITLAVVGGTAALAPELRQVTKLGEVRSEK